MNHNIYNMQALKVYCGTGLMKELLYCFLLWTLSFFKQLRKLNGSTFNEKNEFLPLIANFSIEKLGCLSECARKLIIIRTPTHKSNCTERKPSPGPSLESLKLNLVPRVLSRHERVGHNPGNEVGQTIRFFFSSRATCTAIFLIHYTHHTLSFCKWTNSF